MKWPQGFVGAGGVAGIKADGQPDLGVIVTEHPVSWAGTFTRNAAAAPSVHWCRGLLGHQVRAVVCNSGNANACTGTDGAEAVASIASSTAAAIGCSANEILVASTGPIGIKLPVERINQALPSQLEAAVTSVQPFARAILTTDTEPKTSSVRAGSAQVVGVAKGAAMLAPNMATMLAFIATDAAVDDLQGILSEAVALSFDRICVDACESTNDSVFLLSSGAVPTTTAELTRAVTAVCADLAEQMVRDAEGGSRFVRIEISGATDDAAATVLGRAIASSALWRAAVHGADPNWGRVLAALGSSDRTLDLSSISIAIGPETLFAAGEPSGSLEAARKAMDTEDITLSCVVGTGPGVSEVLSTDLSPDYVTLNAQGST